MQIILLDKVVNLGNLGEIVKVKDGYARNFLIPSGRARRATAMAEADVQAGVAVEHTTVDQRRDRQGFLGCEAGDDVELEALERSVARRAVDAGRAGVDGQRDIEPHRLGIQHIHGWVVERQRRVGAEPRPHQPQFGHGPAQLCGRRSG